MDPEVPPPLHPHFLVLGVREVPGDRAHLGLPSVPESAAGITRRKVEMIENVNLNSPQSSVDKMTTHIVWNRCWCV